MSQGVHSRFECRILVAWSSFHAYPGRCEREALYALLVQWANARLQRVPVAQLDTIYDSFVDRILDSLPTSAPNIGLLWSYWRRSCGDAKRKTMHQQSMVYERTEDQRARYTSLEPEPMAIASETILSAHLALRSLALTERSVLCMRASGLSYDVIATQLDMTRATARALCSRARAKLWEHPCVKRHLDPKQVSPCLTRYQNCFVGRRGALRCRVLSSRATGRALERSARPHRVAGRGSRARFGG